MSGKSILITGCSSGIGRCAAELLKERGYRVFATARKKEDVEKLKSQGFESIELNVDDSNSIKNALEKVLEQTGGTLDALFNNAGYVQIGAVEDLSREILRAQFETNILGSLELITRVLPIMREQGYGRIVQNSSVVGVVTLAYFGAYCASKFALEALIGALRQELKGTHIYASLINPGAIKTPLRSNAHRNFQQTIEQQCGKYHSGAYGKLEELFFKAPEVRSSIEPKEVVKKLIHALEDRRPKEHYYVGSAANFLAFLNRILPDSAMEWFLCKYANP